MFEELSTRLLSGRPGPPHESLPGIFHAAAGERDAASIRVIKPYLESLRHHLDARKAQTKADLVRALDAAEPEAVRSACDRSVRDLERLLETETTSVRNLGALHAVAGKAEALGIADPVVAFVVSRAGACAECVRLHLTPSGEPRAWLQSELGHGYHRKGEDNAKIGGLHPRCRCSLVFVPPGYGYRGGKLSYFSRDYSILDDQRQST